MKTRYILFGLIIFSMAAFARVVKIGNVVVWPSYDYSKPSGVLLPVAYEQATAALGQATNQYHCISATVSNWNFKDGEWDFNFEAQSQTNGASPIRIIAVSFNGTVATNVSPVL
jgi:hypothetical protein